MLAPWRVCANSAAWLRAAACSLALAALVVACGDDPAPAPAAHFLLSQAPPSNFSDYRRLAEEDPAGRETMFENAIERLSKNIGIDSTNVDAYVKRGAAYTAMYVYSGRPPDRDEETFELAVNDLTRAIDLDPNNAEAFIGRGNAYEIREERDKANEDYHAAIELLNKAISLDSNDVEAYIHRAIAYGFARDLGKAMQDLDAAINLDPGNSLAYFARGGTNSAIGE